MTICPNCAGCGFLAGIPIYDNGPTTTSGGNLVQFANANERCLMYEGTAGWIQEKEKSNGKQKTFEQF